MEVKTRAERIEFVPEFDIPRAISTLVDYSGEEWGPDHRIHAILELAYFQHFELVEIRAKLKELLPISLGIIRQYFFGEISEPEQNRNNKWFSILSNGMLLAYLSDSVELIQELGTWIRPNLVPEYMGPLKIQIPQLYLVLAHSAGRPKLDDDFAILLDSVINSRNRRCSMLGKALTAMLEEDQIAFEKLLISSLKVFARKPKLSNRDGYVGERIARLESAICFCAQSRGLSIPVLSPELEARILTRRSVGLEENEGMAERSKDWIGENKQKKSE